MHHCARKYGWLWRPLLKRVTKASAVVACHDGKRGPVLAVSATKGAPRAGLEHQWDLELYGKLLETGGGKERMTAYFTVRIPTQTKTSDAPGCLSREACALASPALPGALACSSIRVARPASASRLHYQQTLRAQLARALGAGARG
jgi:hypothetical protein